MQKGQKGSGLSSTRGSERVRSTRRNAERTEPSEDASRRALAESTKLYYRIGEVSELTGVKAHVLRYWETEFRWMAPPKSRSKQRLYRKRDIEFVWLLKKLLWDQRYTIAGARQRIHELGLEEALARTTDVETLDEVLTGGIAERLAAFPEPALRSDGSPRAGDGEFGSEPPARGDWLGIQVALETMQTELLALRGALQQGL